MAHPSDLSTTPTHPASPSPSSSSSASYDDLPTLLSELQHLLSDTAGTADTSLTLPPASPASPPTRIPVHTQLLALRSPYFATTLRPPWRRSVHPSPAASSPTGDLLEFLYTGCVRLETDSGSAIPVLAAAHYASAFELEAVALSHIRATLSPRNFAAHLRAAYSLPDAAIPEPLVRLLADYAATYPALILTSGAFAGAAEAAAGDGRELVRAVWLLLAQDIAYCAEANAAAAEEAAPPVRDRSSAVEGLLAWSARRAGGDAAPRYVRSQPWPLAGRAVAPGADALAEILEGCGDAVEAGEERAALVAVLAAPNARVFARRVESLGLLSAPEVFDKYRRDALRACGTGDGGA